jgi:hypothetical protein
MEKHQRSLSRYLSAFEICCCTLLCSGVDHKCPVQSHGGIAQYVDGLSIYVSGSWSIQILWTFSIYLEAVAIIPQLIVLQRFGEVENLVSTSVLLLCIKVCHPSTTSTLVDWELCVSPWSIQVTTAYQNVAVF